MEISFKCRETSVWRECFFQTKRTQESAECVVPDTEADIEKIAAVQSAIMLKSKDFTARGVLISGEVSACVLYIREGQDGVSALRLRKDFSIEFETEEVSDAVAEVVLRVQGTDVRVVNPRKIAALFEIEAELSCYRSGSLCTQTLAEDAAEYALHTRTETSVLTLPNAVTEKSFAVNEQFSFPVGTPLPVKLLSEKAELLTTDCQLIGSKLILKGSAEIAVCTLAEDAEVPVLSRFSAPFSQIVDLGIDGMTACMPHVELTGAYYDLIDGINGEKLLDLELHAVVQLVCSGSFGVSCVIDAYSNRMPAELLRETVSCQCLAPEQKTVFTAQERLSLAEDCSELLCVFPSLSRLTNEQGTLSAAVNLDLLYRNGDGALSAGRRTLAVGGELAAAAPRFLNARVLRVEAKAEGQEIDCRVEVECRCCGSVGQELTLVKGLILDEENAFADGAFPTLTLARAKGESLWSLAKRFHSSVESIHALNEDAESTDKMLLIPKCT